MKKAFSLMEMLIALLVISVITAAAAPMLNKKIVKSTADGSSPWVRVGTKGAIAYNLNTEANSVASIGAVTPPDNLKTGLFINTAGSPQLSLGNGGALKAFLSVGSKNNFVFSSKEPSSSTNSVAIGKDVKLELATHSVAIGNNTVAGNWSTVAIGNDVEVKGVRSIAIGNGIKSSTEEETVAIGASAHVSGPYAVSVGYNSAANSSAVAIGGSATNSTTMAGIGSVAVGSNAVASGSNSIVIGRDANAIYDNSVAIGAGASANQANQIVLGTENDTVFIPGRLIVNKTTVLSAFNGETYLRLKRSTPVWELKSLTAGAEDVVSTLDTPTIDGYTVYTTSSGDSEGTVPRRMSDKRLKNIGDVFRSGLEDVKKLEVFNFTFKKDPNKTPRVGVIAQDLQKIFPNSVTKGDDGFLRIRWDEMFFAVINSIKELDAKISALKSEEVMVLQNKVSELEKQNKALVKKNEEFEKRLSKLEKNK